MNAKEKARQLIEKYNLVVLDTALGGSNTRVKKCALIAVDEIMDYLNKVMIPNLFVQYWNEVRNEIENI